MGVRIACPATSTAMLTWFIPNGMDNQEVRPKNDRRIANRESLYRSTAWETVRDLHFDPRFVTVWAKTICGVACAPPNGFSISKESALITLFNINDKVHFRIKASHIHRFVDHPYLRIAKEPVDGYHSAEAQVHSFMYVVGPEMIMGLECPINTTISVESEAYELVAPEARKPL